MYDSLSNYDHNYFLDKLDLEYIVHKKEDIYL